MRGMKKWAAVVAVGALGLFAAGCGDDDDETGGVPSTDEVAGVQSTVEDEATSLHSTDELVTALLTVDDVAYIPAEWEENTRAVVESPTPPYEGTLDPYLCTEAGTPAVLTMPQAQLELTGGSVMEILAAADNAEELYQELDQAYQACGADSSLPYEPLEGVPSVGDESASYRSELGVVTIARFGTDLMVLKWWVGDLYDEAEQNYPQMVTTAADKVTAL